MKKTIAIIGIRGYPSGFPGSGGIDTYIQRLLPKIARKYKHLTLFTRSWTHSSNIQPNKQLSITSIPTINTKYLDTPIYSFFATLIAGFLNFDIVWYHAPGSALLCWLPRLLGKQVYLTIHGVDWEREKWGPIARKVLLIAEFISVRVAHKIFVVSEDLKEYIKNIYNVESQVLAPKVIEKKIVKPNTIIKKYGLKNNNFILYLGRFVPEKRIEWIIRAYLELSNLKKTSKLVLAGNIKNDFYSKELIEMTKNKKNIIFTGHVTGKVKSELLSSCTLFILPSSLEGFSMALIEAVGYKKKCLVSDIKVNRDFSKNNELIHTFNKSSYSDFKNKLKTMLNN